MRNSWNFSTAILEIWVLVLTKPGWANETPTTSLRSPRENTDHHFQYHHHHHHHHTSHHNHYSLAGDPKDFFSSRTNNQNYLEEPQLYSDNRHAHHHHHHSGSPIALPLYSPHRCYVCLPPNKQSKEALQILDLFAKELRPFIPDCSQFDPYVDTARFEFDCPPKYGGCILRIHGTNVSRACSKYRVNTCKTANSVQFCYCNTLLCNDRKPEPPLIPAVVQQHVSRNAPNGDRPLSRTQGVDDEEILTPDRINRINVVDNDDEDNGGSGTGSPDHSKSFIDPYISTMDPTMFHEETPVDVEDPNAHTKIGISMTASTSSSSSATSLMTRSTNIIHLVRVSLVMLGEGALSHVQRFSSDIDYTQNHLDEGHYVEGSGRTKILEAPGGGVGRLCFIISFILVLRALS